MIFVRIPTESKCHFHNNNVMRLNPKCSIRAYAVVNIHPRWSDDVMRSVCLNHLPQDNKNHTLYRTISREGALLKVTGPSIQLIYILNVPVQQFKVFTCRHLQSCLFWQRRSYKNWCRLTVIFWTPPPPQQIKATHNQRSHNKPLSSNKSNQSLPDYVNKSSTNTSYTELNQEVDMQRYIFLITYDVLVSGKMAGYYMVIPV